MLVMRIQWWKVDKWENLAPFDKTDGNVYIEFEPAEVKFQGYELNTTRQAQIRVINKAPIPQRIHILPPTEECFSIKVGLLLYTGEQKRSDTHWYVWNYLGVFQVQWT